MMSIVFHHYKILKEHFDSKIMLFSNKEKEEEDYINNNQNPSIILQRIRKMETYSDILR